MASLARYEPDEQRSPEELAAFAAPMPSVTAGVFALGTDEDLKESARLFPIIAQLSGRGSLSLSNILMMGGGVLLDKYSRAEDLFKLYAGKTREDGERDGLDFHLWDNPIKWREMLIHLHRAAALSEGEERKLVAQEFSMDKYLASFEQRHDYKPLPEEYAAPSYAKALFRVGLTWSNDDRCDWRRARPASARRESVTDANQLTEVVTIENGATVGACLNRKCLTTLLVHGSNNIAGQGFQTDGYGDTLVDGARRVRFLTLTEYHRFVRATAGFKSIPKQEAERIADWFDEEMSKLTSDPLFKTASAGIEFLLNHMATRLANAFVHQSAARGGQSRGTPTNTPGGANASGPNGKKRKKAGGNGGGGGTSGGGGGGTPNAASGGGGNSGGGGSSDARRVLVHGDTLERLPGGNPAGPPCRRFNNGQGTCNHPSGCRFSHVVTSGNNGNAGGANGGNSSNAGGNNSGAE